MAKINYDFYDNKDIYNDGEVERELLEYYKDNKELDTTRDDIFFLTTQIRENIISWYPFNKDASVLEIGAGLGTVTGALCKNAKYVTSVEASKRRAEVLYERHKQNDNLEVIVANFSDIKFKEKYDYIVLIGVFEYSKIFFDVKEPFNYFLEKLKSILKSDGKIIIAIENRYGIKYWSGNNEDHIGKPYQGLIGYENKKVQTFGKKELVDLITASGFKSYKFYYPFPDYKMPQVIYTDEKLPSSYEIASIPVYNFSSENYNFNPREILKGLEDNDMFGFFANSFIVEITNGATSNVAYAKYQPTRRQEYSTITIINDDNKVFKKPLSDGSILHLEHMQKIHEKLSKNNINTYKISKNNDMFELSFLEGKNLEEIIINDFSNAEMWIDKYIEFVHTLCKKGKMKKFANEKMKKIYENESTYILKVGLLDFNFGNVIINNDQFYLFDQEWETDYDVPADYVVYFSIKLLFEKIDNFESKKEKELYKKYGITKEMQKAFNEFSFNYFNKIKNVTDINTFVKLKEHGAIRINDERERLLEGISCYEKDIEFYKNLLEKTKSGYEKEIERLNNIIEENEQSKKNKNWLKKFRNK